MTASRQTRRHYDQDTMPSERARSAADPASSARISYEEFLDWADEDTLAEWVDGKVIMASPANTQHQRISAFLSGLLSLYTAMHGNGEVFSAPFQMNLPTASREPDLLFVTADHRDHIKANYLDGPADLVVEIVSPESVERDHVTKLAEYEQGGIQEYWIIDPLDRTVILYQRTAQGTFARMPPNAEDRYTSRMLPGFWIESDWLWQEPLPDLILTLLAITGGAFRDHVDRRAGQSGADSHSTAV